MGRSSPHDEMMSRVLLMSVGNPKWDLSPNDLEALKYVLKRIKDLEMVCDNRGRREEELREAMGKIRQQLNSLDKYDSGSAWGVCRNIDDIVAPFGVLPAPPISPAGDEK